MSLCYGGLAGVMVPERHLVSICGTAGSGACWWLLFSKAKLHPGSCCLSALGFRQDRNRQVGRSTYRSGCWKYILLLSFPGTRWGLGVSPQSHYRVPGRGALERVPHSFPPGFDVVGFVLAWVQEPLSWVPDLSQRQLVPVLLLNSSVHGEGALGGSSTILLMSPAIALVLMSFCYVSDNVLSTLSLGANLILTTLWRRCCHHDPHFLSEKTQIWRC